MKKHLIRKPYLLSPTGIGGAGCSPGHNGLVPGVKRRVPDGGMKFAHFPIEARRPALACAEKSKIDGSGHRHKPVSVVPDHRASFSRREWFSGLETDDPSHVSGKP